MGLLHINGRKDITKSEHPTACGGRVKRGQSVMDGNQDRAEYVAQITKAEEDGTLCPICQKVAMAYSAGIQDGATMALNEVSQKFGNMTSFEDLEPGKDEIVH